MRFDLVTPIRSRHRQYLLSRGAVPERLAGAQAVGNPQEQGADQHLLPTIPDTASSGSRVGDGEQVQHLQQAQRADGPGDVVDDGRVVQIPVRGRTREQQVVADCRLQQLPVRTGYPQACSEVPCDSGADRGVVASLAFADVVEERSQREEVFRPDLGGDRRPVAVVSDERLHLVDGPPQMGDHGMVVERLDLRGGEDPGPLGYELFQSRQQVVAVPLTAPQERRQFLRRDPIPRPRRSPSPPLPLIPSRFD